MDINTTETILAMSKEEKITFINGLREQIIFANRHMNDLTPVHSLSYDENCVLNYMIRGANVNNRYVFSIYHIATHMDTNDASVRGILDLLVSKDLLRKDKQGQHDVFILKDREVRNL